jgi:hypothetical protein
MQALDVAIFLSVAQTHACAVQVPCLLQLATAVTFPVPSDLTLRTIMKIALLALTVALVAGMAMRRGRFSEGAESAGDPETPTPVLVELFTSEGCSSCPPADRFLQEMDRQPRQGAELIVLSEHVDYWNHIGWKDPFSSHFFSERQSAYANRFGLDSVYTPQMVVDGSTEFVGSNAEKADQALQSAAQTAKIPIQLSSLSFDASHTMRARLEAGLLDDHSRTQVVEVYVAIALNHAESQVSAGENAGHQLTHVAVVRTLSKVAELKRGQTLNQDIAVKIDASYDPHNLRAIAFLQEPHQGRIVGATHLVLNAN